MKLPSPCRVKVELGQLEGEAVRVFQFNLAVVAADDDQPVGERAFTAWKDRLEKAAWMHLFHGGAFAIVEAQHIDANVKRAKGAHCQRFFATDSDDMRPQYRIGRTVIAANQSLDLVVGDGGDRLGWPGAAFAFAGLAGASTGGVGVWAAVSGVALSSGLTDVRISGCALPRCVRSCAP
jgi:hypothetical protein